MRKNFPVTQCEYHMQDGRPIVSKTDLKGKITYVNPYFIEVSGFEESELIGAPHNIVRHPDMPAEAFDDLWRTLKSGLPWSAMVKNRRKNGDYYWVIANATPLVENGVTTGYLSVRTKPTRAQIDVAENLYRNMREGTANAVIMRGQLLRKGVLGWLDQLRQLSLAKTIAILESIPVAILLGIAVGALARAHGNADIAVAATIALIWILLSAWILHLAVVAPMGMAEQAARALAGGDLTVDVDGNRGGQMGLLLRALRQTSVNLRSVMGDVRTNIESMHLATGEIATGNMDLSSRTEEQASSLEETAASMEELSSTVKQNSESARQASHLAAQSSALATTGSEVVASVGKTMGGIADSAVKIKDIVGLIDGIAFQTNILALNAAVEAARAGEHGRGFAVVAGEVRSLAQRAAGAAKDVKGLIDISVTNIDTGNELVRKAEASMRAILESARHAESYVADIATASVEQASGIEQINQAVMQMEDVTQQNAAMVEEAAAAAARLDEQAGLVTRAISLFKTEKMGQTASIHLVQADDSENDDVPQPRQVAPKLKSKRVMRIAHG